MRFRHPARSALYVAPVALTLGLAAPSQSSSSAQVPQCPPFGVITTFKATDRGHAVGSFIATHPLMISATASPPRGSDAYIDMDTVKVTPGSADGAFTDFTPMVPGPQTFVISWLMVHGIPDPAGSGQTVDETCAGSVSKTVQVLPARRVKIGAPKRYAPLATWMVGRSGLFEIPFLEDTKAPDATPVIVALRARRGTRIPLTGPASVMRITSGGDTPPEASMNGVRIRYRYGRLEIHTWRNPGPKNGLLIDITQSGKRLRRIGVQLHCSKRVAAVFACVYRLRPL